MIWQYSVGKGEVEAYLIVCRVKAVVSLEAALACTHSGHAVADAVVAALGVHCI